ncbi:MAG: putative transcription regulator aminotransferase GntR-related [Paucimonas sp.]|nr:putative transcription regulator aminotransferase GntR-related [Paucimonas sp.]
MTNTAHLHKLPLLTHTISRESGESLVEQIVRLIETRIDDKLLRTGSRMPSIRLFADSHGVSRFTVVEAYDRLVAKGLLESRRGSGFYVRERQLLRAPRSAVADAASKQIDVAWLVRNMFREHPPQRMPGSGLLPVEWLDGELVAASLRSISRQQHSQLLHYGSPQGFLPLRQQLQLKLAELEIAAAPEQIVTTAGITQGLDLVARQLARPGDTVFVDDPAWFHMFGMLAEMGMKVVGIPRLPDGPDIERLDELAALHKPKFFVINSVLHNPTSTSMSAARAFQVLKIEEQHDFIVVEYDIYCDMNPGGPAHPVMRVASLDQLKRVIYLGGFSKTVAANLRVGFIAASPDMARRLTDQKMLTALTTPEVGERVIYKILSEGHFRKHVDRLRAKMDEVRDRTLRQLERVGLKVDGAPSAGIFVWANAGCDTNVLAEKAMEEGYLFAPGSLFSPSQLPSHRTRINIATMSDPGVLRFLSRHLDRA